jgi:hypothetical protein
MNILMELPSERPIRIHLGMNVMQSKLVTKVYPKYPDEALKKRLQGKGRSPRIAGKGEKNSVPGRSSN